MSRFYFDFIQGRSRMRDDVGHDFSDAGEAERHAHQVAYELVRNVMPFNTIDSHVVVLDQEGQELMRVALCDVSETGSLLQRKLRLVH